MLISEPASRRKPVLPLFQARDLLDPLPEPLGGDVVAEAVAGGVVGDRQVGVAAVAGRLGHLLERVAAVGEGRVGVQVAADVVDARPARAACPRAPPSARRGPRAAPARCRRSRAARRPRSSVAQSSTSPLSVSVMPCSETERPRATASSRSCTLWALEPVKCWSRLPKAAGGDDPQVDRDRRCGSGRGRRSGPGCRRAAISGWAARCSASALRLLGGGDQVDVLAGLGPAPDRAGDLDPVGGGVLAQRRRQLLGDRPDLGEQQAAGALAGLAEPLQRGEDVLLDLRAEPLDLADLFAPPPPPSGPPAWRSELVEEPARGFRAERRGPGSPRSASAGTSPSASPRRGSRRSPAARRSFPPASCRRRGSRSPGRRRPARRPRPGSRGSPWRRCCRRARGI